MTSPAADLRRPRLLVLASTYPRWVGDPEPGFVHELCRRLVDDFDVVVVCPSAPGALRRETMDGIDVQRFRYAPNRLEMLVNGGGITSNLRRNPWLYLLVLPFVLGMGIGVLAALRSHKPAVVHAHWLLPQGLIAALLLPRRLPLVVTSHGADLFAWRGRLFRAMKRFVLRRASTATVVSTPMVDEVVRLGMPPARVVVAPMGVDLCGRFTPDASVPRSAAEILFVGRLVEKKGLRHLIAAMPAIIEAIPDATLVVAGFGPEMAARIAQANTAGVGHAIRFAGPVPQASLPGMYRRATVFVAPFVEGASGDRDGLGLVSIEAAGCGCPVVISDLSVVHDIFEPGEAKFANPGDPVDLATKVIEVLRGTSTSPVERTSLRDRFDWDGVARCYKGILSRAVDQETGQVP